MKVAVSDEFGVGEWRHTVLELYALDKPWPTEGEPAEWVEKKLVAYCQGDDETVVIFTPIGRLLWWKSKRWANQVREALSEFWLTYTPWGRATMRDVDKFWTDLPVVHCEDTDGLG